MSRLSGVDLILHITKHITIPMCCSFAPYHYILRVHERAMENGGTIVRYAICLGILASILYIYIAIYLKADVTVFFSLFILCISGIAWNGKQMHT